MVGAQNLAIIRKRGRRIDTLTALLRYFFIILVLFKQKSHNGGGTASCNLEFNNAHN